MKIDNEVYTAPLSDPESEEYRIFKDNFVPALTRILSDSLETADGTLAVEIVSIRYLVVYIFFKMKKFRSKHIARRNFKPCTIHINITYVIMYLCYFS